MKQYFLCAAGAAILLVGCNSSTKSYIIEGKATNPKLEGKNSIYAGCTKPSNSH